MPNYSLVVNSKFKPTSLQEMLVPFKEYGTAYREQEDALAELAANASVWNGMVDAENDTVAAKQLKKYNDDLLAQRDAIATSGLDPGSRRKALDLKARYASEVGSIEKAYEAREEVRKAQQEAYIKSNGNVRYSKRADTDSLDNYLNGKKPEYLMFNLNDVMTESAVGAKAMSERYFKTTEGKAFGDQYFNLIETQGLNPQQAMRIMENLADENPEQYKEFNKFRDDLKTKYGVDQFNLNDQNAFNAAVMQGFNSGITYSRSNKPLQNGEYLSAADRFSQEMQEKRYELEKKELELKKNATNSLPLPNGDTATKKNGVWEITDPDGNSKSIVTNSELTKIANGYHLKPEGFKPLDFEFNLFGSDITFFDSPDRGLIHNNYFSTSDAKKLSSTWILQKERQKAFQALADKLKEYGLTINDVDIYEDYDLPSRSAYRVVYKDDDINGNSPEEPAGNDKSASGNNASSNRYNGGFAD